MSPPLPRVPEDNMPITHEHALQTLGPRGYLNALADCADEYAGLPYPLEGEELTVHPKYRFASVLAKPKEEMDVEVINCWHSSRRPTCNAYVLRDKSTGRIWGGYFPATNQASMTIHTMGIASAWDFKAEMKAQEKLASLIHPHLWEMYFLTGGFLETSKRSGLLYIFRRLRPTLVIRKTDPLTVLCGLCLHPIGYYKDTWAGSLCPTDEVIAHLLLMRGDEHRFWKQANQHPAWSPLSGL